MQSLLTLIYSSYFMSILFIVIGVPLALDKVKPNGMYGIRIQKTFESPEMWYSVNNLGGKAFIIAGVLSIIIGFLLQRYWSADLTVKSWIIFSLPLVLGAVGIIYAIKVG